MRSPRPRCGRSCTRLASIPRPGGAGPTWRQFLTSQAHAIIACDFLVVETVLLQRLYVLVFIEHGTRRLHVAGVTACPTGAWAAQQALNLAMDLGDRLGTLRFLIQDRDPVFTTVFGEVFRSEGLRIITTLPKTPRMNAICERVNGTHRRELLDRILIVGERHLAQVLREYATHSNGHRPHQSLRQRPPDMQAQPAYPGRGGPAIRPPKRAAAGVINEYHHAASLQLRPRNSIFERHTVQQRRQQCPVSRGEPHPARTELPLQDQELVAQREDLRVLVLAAHRQQPKQREHVRHTEVGQSQQHGPPPCHSVPRHTSAPPGTIACNVAPLAQRLPPARMRFSAGARSCTCCRTMHSGLQTAR
jgi:putative transposase